MEGEKKKKKKINLKEIGIDKLVLIIIAGVVLVICSFPSSDKESDSGSNNKVDSTTSQSQDDITYEQQLEQKLQDILKNVEGAGNVQVMITLKTSSEKVIKEDSQYSKSDTIENDSEGGNRQINDISSQGSSVFTTDENGNSVPYVIKEIRPQIEGVAVIAEGGDDAAVTTSIINTIEALFNVSANKISVSKMREVK